jgi:undecaprenyl-diphosphatase
VCSSAELLSLGDEVEAQPDGVLDAARPAVEHECKFGVLGTFYPMGMLVELDHQLVDVAPMFESSVLTSVFIVLSAWWVKGPLLIGMGLAADVWRRRLPVAFLAAGAATLATSLVVDVLKNAFDRARPPESDPGLGSLVALPDNPSFPSGHSATAFAAATAVAVLCPKLRLWALGLAAAVALSRVYLRVHFPLDVLVGGVIGAGLGALAGFFALNAAGLRRRPEVA